MAHGASCQQRQLSGHTPGSPEMGAGDYVGLMLEFCGKRSEKPILPAFLGPCSGGKDLVTCKKSQGIHDGPGEDMG